MVSAELTVAPHWVFEQAPVLISPPAVLPVTLEEARQHLRVDASDQDFVINGQIAAATDFVERDLQRALITQTWAQFFSGFVSPMRLAWLPIATAGSPPGVPLVDISYIDGDGEQQDFDTSGYSIITDTIGAKIVSLYPASWPSVYSRSDAVTVTYVVGYGDTGAAVPAMIRQAILLMVGEMFDSARENAVAGTIAGPVATTIDRLLWPYRRLTV
jgi:uncharacterized phiE125 gp8 family phage protein